MSIDREGEGPPLRKASNQPDDPNALRATPFTEDVFDDEYYRGRGRAASGGSPLGLIFGVIVGAAVAGSTAWFVLKDNGLSGPTGPDGVPVVKAEPSPYKIKPENPGGMQVANQDKTVYDRVAKSDAPDRVENLLPPPEKPKAPPKVEPKPAAKPETETAQVATPKDASQAVLDEKRDELAAMITALEEKNKPSSPAQTESQPAPAIDTPAPAADQSVPPAQTASVPSDSTGFQVQLAAAKSEDAAMAEWTRIKSRHPDALGKLTPSVMRADLGERGIFFRLRAGFLPDRAAADALCAALSTQGDACLVVKP